MQLKEIVLDMQSQLYAKAIRRSLVQELEDYNIVISKTPRDTVGECRVLQPYALLMEVTGYSPWMLPERLAILEAVKREAKACKIVLIVDDAANRALAREITNAKRDGLIDAFLFASVTESYLAAVMDSL